MKGAGGERNQTPGPGLISKMLKPDGSTGISIQSCKRWTSGLFQGSTDFLLLRIGVSDAHTKENLGFPCGSDGKESTCNATDPGSIPWLGRSPGEGNGNPLQSVFLPGEFHGQRSLVGYIPLDCKEPYMTKRLSLSLVKILQLWLLCVK